MPDYRRLYHDMFNAVTDALRRMELGQVREARQLLILAQQEAEHRYLADDSHEPPIELLK